MSDIWMMLAFGVVGFLMNKLEIPLPPLVIAFVLGPQIEQSLRRGLLLSRGEWSVFVTHPISLGFLLLAAVFVMQIVRKARGKRQLASPEAS